MKRLVIVALVCVSVTASASTRPAAMAGAFYPSDAEELRAQVESMIAEAKQGGVAADARALIVPHAGYVFSGPTAAKAFAALPAKGVTRVILLGPSHHYNFSGGALPEKDLTAFETPLGLVKLDREAIERLRKDRLFSGPVKAHDGEHSLEVELPFLQLVAPGARLVPVVVGSSTDLSGSTHMAEAIAELLDDGTVVIASSDFTHHGDRYGWSPYGGPDLGNTLLRVGRQTVERAVAMDPRGFLTQVEVSGDTVCGVRPVGVLTALLAHAFEGAGKVLEVTTSGHVTGSFDLSVTYAAVAFKGGWKPWAAAPDHEAGELSKAEGQKLIAFARAVLQSRLSHDTSVAAWFAENGSHDRLLMPAGAFVTVNNTGSRARSDGKLRACMGVIEAEQPLLDAVVQASVWAVRDPRFPPLRLEELEKVELEVSVLSPTQPVRSPRFIKVGEHGVVLEKDGRRAVFLPQVATEQGWNRDTMLDQLSLKAGLHRKAWESGAVFEVFTAQVLAEHE